MKTSAIFALLLLISACNTPIDQEAVKQEIFQTEKAFEKMCAEKGIGEAFHHFAAEDAVIKRQNDTLVIGRENIRQFYSDSAYLVATVAWTPDFIDVSECGTLAYTYGKYLWKIRQEDGTLSEYPGVFHTVWKKQEDGSWKYVWD